METIVLVIHLILALGIIALVLVQRSSGGGLGIGGGGMGDFATAKSTATALTKVTTYFAIAFFCTSLSLAWLAANNNQQGVLDSLTTEEAEINIPVDIETIEPEVPTAN